MKGRGLVAMLLVAMAIGLAAPLWAQGPQKRVLVLHSRRADAAFSKVADRELPELLDRALGGKVDYYSEHLDTARFPEPRYQRAFRDFLRLKYRETRFDAVIATHELALGFVARYRAALFPGVPVVFLSEDSVARRMPNSTGVVVKRNFTGTLRLALELQPETTHVFVVSGSSVRDKEAERDAREEFGAFTPRLTFTYLTGLTARALDRRLAALPPQSIVYYVLFYQDATGANFNPIEYVDHLASVSNRPMYSWVDSTMGRGVVGGRLQNLGRQVDLIGQLTTRILRRERADTIPIQSPALEREQVDWRQLQRWAIPESRVAQSTQILFRVPTLWARYSTYIVGLVVLMLAQTIFIAFLFVQRTQLRRAEELARSGEARLRASYDRIRDLGGRLIAAQDAERARIARELHDDISQQIALMGLELRMLTDMVPHHDLDSEGLSRGLIDRVRTLGRSVHDLSHQLHPAKLRLIGLVSAIDGLRREFSRPGMTIAFSHIGVPAELPHDLTVALFRVVQEAVRNAVEHSGAVHVSVQLFGAPSCLSLTIEDDGTGFDVHAAADQGLGLISMKERLESIGGVLTIRSSPGSGTRLAIDVAMAAPVVPVAAQASAGAGRDVSIHAVG